MQDLCRVHHLDIVFMPLMIGLCEIKQDEGYETSENNRKRREATDVKRCDCFE